MSARPDGLLDSTETARAVRLHAHDPLWRRYEQLRAAGTLRPVTLEPVPLFDPEHVAQVARPWEHIDDQADVYEPARGIEIAVIASFVAFVAVVILIGATR